MSKLSDAVKLINAADARVEWDTSGACMVVRTVVLEKDGAEAGVLERNYSADTAPPPGDVVVGLQGNAATGEGAAL